MLAGLLSQMEGSAVAAVLRGSVWLYPLVNAVHVLGVALLVGAILPLDLRLLGLWRGIPVAQLRRVLVPVAATGLLTAVVAGALLFAARATEYAASPLFRAKMLVVALGVVNALALRRLPAWRDGAGALPVPLRMAGAGSLGLWVTALLLGRLVGYF